MREGAPKRVVVVGAGIAGLAAAYRMARLAEAQRLALSLTVLEGAARVGGVIETAKNDGVVMELGPDSIITDKPWALDLCREIGLGPRVLSTEREHAGSLIVRDGRLLPVPDGFHLMAPSRLFPFVVSSLLSLRGKFRVGAELFIPPRKNTYDESLAAFVRRRLGEEALTRIAQPMVGGIYTADPEKLSLAATMPRFLEMEQRYGSVIRGMIAARRQRDSAVGHARGPRYELFVALREGMAELPHRLLEQLPPGSVRLGCKVRRIQQQERGWSLATDSESFEADAVCVAAPAHTAAEMIGGFAPALASDLFGIEYASSATVNLLYDRGDVGDALRAFGFVVPAIERLPLIACTYSSRKYAHRAPPEKVLLRAFVGGALFPEQLERDDADMIDGIHACLARLLRISAPPRQAVVTRWPRSMPQYHVGHLARVDRIEKQLQAFPTLALAGNAYRGTGIPDTVRVADEAARKLFKALFVLPGFSE
jgi:oxygen-dependent protoporphyrinogen oxidase